MPTRVVGQCCCQASQPTSLSLNANIWFDRYGTEIPPNYAQVLVTDQNGAIVYNQGGVDISNGSTIVGTVGSTSSYAETTSSFTFVYRSITYRCDFTCETPFSMRQQTNYLYNGPATVTSVTFTAITQ